jgi:hypothetical protein
VTGPDTGVYGWSTGTGGVHFFRVAEPLRVAHQGGIRVGWGQRLDDAICEAFDTVLVHMLWDERNSEAWEQLAAGGHHRLVLDIDDWMWEPDWEPFRKHYTPTVLDRVYRNVKLAHVITTPSPRIADHLSRYNPNVHGSSPSTPIGTRTAGAAASRIPSNPGRTGCSRGATTGWRNGGSSTRGSPTSSGTTRLCRWTSG